MATPVENCLIQLHREMLPGQELRISDEPATTVQQRRRSQKAKKLKSHLVNFLQKKGIVSSKLIQNRAINYYRYIRSAYSAGLLKTDFSAAEVTDEMLPECRAKAIELWKKNAFEYALWCSEQEHDYPEHFLEAELIPWQMEEFAKLGINRDKAAQMSISLCQKVQLLPSSAPENAGGNFPADGPESALSDRNEKQASPFTAQEQINILQSCLQELKANKDSRKITPNELFDTVLSRRQR